MPATSSNRVGNSKPHHSGKSTPSTNLAIVVMDDKSCKRRKKAKAKASNSVTSPDATVPFQYPSWYFENRVLQPSWLVQTPYGVGTVVECRVYEQGAADDDYDSDDDNEETAFDLSKKTTGEYKYFIRLTCDSDSISPFSRLVTFDNYPSAEPQIGSEVVLTCFDRSQNYTLQRGRVVNLRPHLGQAVVRLVSWRLLRETSPSTAIACKLSKNTKRHTGSMQKPPPEQRHYPTVSFVTCYLGYESIQVVSPKPVEAMSAYETLLYVDERQHLAYDQYVARQYATCCDLYESAITAIRSLLFEKHMADTQTVRGNLILTQIRCCNQAAVCCLHMENFQGVIGHAMSSLKMLRALEKKRDMSDDAGSNASSTSGMSSGFEAGTDRQERRQFDRLCGEMRVFGVWRIKSMQLLTLALVKFSQWEHAKEICLQAHKIVVKYTTQVPPNTSKLRRSAFRDYLGRKAQLLHVDKSLLRLYARIEQRRGNRNKPTDHSIVVVDQDNARDGDDVSTLDDIEQEWLDEDEERDMEKDWQPMAVVVGQLPEHGGILLLPSPRRDDVDSVVTDASCDLSSSRASHVGVRTKALAMVQEDKDPNQTMPSTMSDLGTESTISPAPVDASRRLSSEVPTSSGAILTVPSTITSDSEGSCYEGTAKVSPSQMSEVASGRADDSKDTVGGHAAKEPAGERHSRTSSSKSEASWDVVDLDTCLAEPYTSTVQDANQRNHSAVLIQAVFRGALARRARWELYMRCSIAATAIQTWYRGTSARRKYQSRIFGRKSAATRIQAAQRGNAHRSLYRRDRNAIVRCQAQTRGFLARRRLQRVKHTAVDACLVVQAWRRGAVQRRDFLRQREAAVAIQSLFRAVGARVCMKRRRIAMQIASVRLSSWFRGVTTRRETERFQATASASANKIQAAYRCRCRRTAYRLQQKSAIVLQSHARSLVTRRQLERTRLAILPAIILLQAWWRGSLSRKQLLAKHNASVRIQAVFRGACDRRYCGRHEFEVLKASMVIQSWYRGCLQRRAIKQYHLNACEAARKLQTVFRGRKSRKHLERMIKSVVIVQGVVRLRAAQKEFKLLKDTLVPASRKLQACQRASVKRREYCRNRKSIITVQSLVRKKRALQVHSEYRSAAKRIQAAYRLVRYGRELRRHYKDLRLSLVLTQALVRKFLAVRRFERMMATIVSAALCIQAWRRKTRQRAAHQCVQRAVVLLQSCVRRHQARLCFAGCEVSMDAAAVKIQKAYRGAASRRAFQSFKDAALLVAAKLTAHQLRRKQQSQYVRVLRAVVRLQSLLRGHQARQCFAHRKASMEAAAVKIQAVYRGAANLRALQRFKDAGFLVTAKLTAHQLRRKQQSRYVKVLRAVSRIQTFTRQRRDSRQASKEKSSAATTMIQAVYRRHRAQRHYRHVLHSVLLLQSFAQMILAGNKINRMKAISVTPAEQNAVAKAPTIHGSSQVLVNEGADASSTDTPTSLRSSSGNVEDSSSRRPANLTGVPASDVSVPDSVASNADSNAKNQFYETASHAFDASEVGSLNSARFSTVSAPVRLSTRTRKPGAVARRAFVDPETLRQLKARTSEARLAPVPASPATPSTASQLSSPGMKTEDDYDDASAVSEDASQITSASAYFDAASQHSGGGASDAGDSLHSAHSRASGVSAYSRFSVVSAPAFVRSEMGNVRDRHGNVTSARKVFVDNATLKRLQKRSRPKTSSSRRKPFIAPHLMEELTEGGSMTSMREPGRFEAVFEEPPDDNWRDEIKVFAPGATKKKTSAGASAARKGRQDGENAFPSGASVGGASVGAASVGGASVGAASASRRVSFARDVVFSEDFTAGGVDRFDDALEDASVSDADPALRPRRRAWYQTREFRAGVGTLVASGASIGTLIASKFMKNR